MFAIAVMGLLSGERPIGDGRDPSTYGFELGDLASRPGLVASGHPRDFMPALDDPETIPGDAVAEYNATHRRRPVVSTDRVVGVVIGAESRAYPIPLLEVHEIVNDELGGVPIAISFSPLADAVVVTRREVDGSPVRFGLSGLMLDATHLLYDRSENESPSLWSPIRRRAVSGPRAGRRLDLVPGVAVLSWRDWLRRHPETTVALGDEGSRLRNRRVDYAHYRGDEAIPLPVAEIEALAPSERKAPVIAVRTSGTAWRVVSLSDLETLGAAALQMPDVDLETVADVGSRTIAVQSDLPIEIVPCMRFATLGVLDVDSSEVAADASSPSRSDRED